MGQWEVQRFIHEDLELRAAKWYLYIFEFSNQSMWWFIAVARSYLPIQVQVLDLMLFIFFLVSLALPG